MSFLPEPFAFRRRRWLARCHPGPEGLNNPCEGPCAASIDRAGDPRMAEIPLVLGEEMSLNPIAPDIWIADGPPVSFFGFDYPARMSVVHFADGSLWICSPIKLTLPLSEIGALGPVRHPVSQNKTHHLFLGDWNRRWPAARLYASPGLARRRADLHFDAELCYPNPAWAAGIDQVIFHGSFVKEEVVFFHQASRTAIVTDLVQRFDPDALRG